MSQPYQQQNVEVPMHFRVKLVGNAAELVNEKINEKKNSLGLITYGKRRAVEVLLCELWELKQQMKQQLLNKKLND